jgi:hypothetical protein
MEKSSMTSIRCDTCRAKEEARPLDLGDVLCYLAPPLELLNYLDKAIAAQGDKAPAKIVAYREKWRRLNAGEPMPEVDRLDSPVQAELVKAGATYA